MILMNNATGAAVSGMSAIGISALPDVSGFQSLGASAVALGLMWYFIQAEKKRFEEERAERQAVQKRLDDKATIMANAVADHGEAMKANAAASAAIATVLNRLLDAKKEDH